MGSDRRCLSPGILAALSCTLPATIMSHHWLYVTISRIYATGLRCGGYFSQAVPSEAWPEIIGLLQRLGHCYLMIRQITAEWWSTSISGLRWSGTWWSLHCYAPDIWPHCQWFLGRWIILGFGNPVGLLYKRFLIHQIGRAHVWTPVTSAHLVCRLLLEKKKIKQTKLSCFISHKHRQIL